MSECRRTQASVTLCGDRTAATSRRCCSLPARRLHGSHDAFSSRASRNSTPVQRPAVQPCRTRSQRCDQPPTPPRRHHAAVQPSASLHPPRGPLRRRSISNRMSHARDEDGVPSPARAIVLFANLSAVRRRSSYCSTRSWTTGAVSSIGSTLPDSTSARRGTGSVPAVRP